MEKETISQQKNHEIVHLLTNYRSDNKLMNNSTKSPNSTSKQFLPMLPKEATPEQNDVQAYYVKTEDEYVGLVNHISMLHGKGVNLFGEICILFNKNSDIFDFAKYALKIIFPFNHSLPLDLIANEKLLIWCHFSVFLVNPYDNLNLHILMRSPWFNITDQEVFNLRQSTQNKSFWQQLKISQHEDSKKLNQYLYCYQQNGALAALEKFILESDS